jgi:hypothetical protein
MIEALTGFVLAFIAMGIQERYLKPASVRALAEIEKRVLPLVFERLDPIMPDLLMDAKKNGSGAVLGMTILKEIVSAAEDAEIDLSGQVGPAYQRFLELYDPVVNARRFAE